ncbi:MAG: PKD domain-containing protein [Chitinophagales bacterium]
MKIIKLLISAIFVSFHISCVFSQIPSNNLKLWLQADSNVVLSSNTVASWNDVNFNGFSAVQPNANSRPTQVFDNSIQSNTIQFDGIDNILLVDFGTLTPQANTYFIVWKTNGTTPIQIAFGSFPKLNALLTNNNQLFLNAGTGQSYYNEPLPFNYIISSCVFNGTQSKLYRNGVLKNTKNSGSNELDAVLEIGGLRAQAAQFPSIPGWLNGNIAEFIMYDSLLTDTERAQVELYLANKYTQPLTLGPDTIACASNVKIGFKHNPQFENITWSTNAVNTDSIVITQNGTYWVQAQSFGLSVSDTIVVSGIVTPPTISITNDTVICYGDSLIINYTPLPGFTPLWSNGSSNNSIVVKDFNQSIQLSHSDVNNCSAITPSYNIVIDSLKLQSSIGDDRNICDGGSILLNTSSAQGPFSYLWSTGDTLNFTIPNLPGVQDVWLEMQDFNLCYYRDTISVNIINLPAPNANFSFDTACPFTPTSFIDLSSPGGTDNIVSWLWKFNANDTSTLQNASYSFNEGVFNVILEVSTDSGCINSTSKLIRTHKRPYAIIEDIIACAQSETNALSSSFVAIPDFINTYSWVVEGQTYNGPNPSLTINNSGDIDFQLTVTSDKNCIDSTTKTIEIFPAINPDFEAQNLCFGDTTQFIDQSASFSIIDRFWSFGETNAFSSEESPSYFYDTTDSFTVRLSATNALGCISSIEKEIVIHPRPTAIALVDGACENQISTLYDASIVANGFVSEMLWHIEADSFLNDSVEYLFQQAGTYSVYHAIIDNFSCTDDTIFNLIINEIPLVDFDFSPSYGTAPLLVEFNNLSDNSYVFSWDFGTNSATSSDINPSYTYEENGVYNITLNAINSFGCSNIAQSELSVIPTELDVELSNLSVERTVLVDGKIGFKAKVLIKNVGTRKIENIDLAASINNENKLVEQWEGSLDLGQAVLYEFQSFFELSNEDLLKYICVSAHRVNDNTEVLTQNNKACIIQEGLLQSSKVYPNPSRDLAYLDLVAKNKGEIQLEIIETSGKVVLRESNISIQKGYNLIQVDCVNLQAGNYYVNILFQDESYSHQLIISNK